MLSVTNMSFMLNVIILSVIMLSVIMLSVIMLSVVILSVVMLSVVMLRIVMPGIVMSSVVMLNATAPYKCTLMQSEPSQVKVTTTFAKFAAKNCQSSFLGYLG
jgi:hypothetical protein